jgi:endonuclease III
MKLAKLLDRLEKFYGKPAAAGKSKSASAKFGANLGPTDPYEMVLHRNAGYPQSDVNCDKGFQSLKREIGLSPEKILAAPPAKLAEALRVGVMMPELAARRMKEIAARVLGEFGGDLRAVMKRGPVEAKKALKKFPTIGDSFAEKVLLYAGVAPVAAVPANSVHVLLRLGFGLERKNYAANYRTAQEVIAAEIPETHAARLRAYLLIKQHGQTLCKLAHPKCDECPVSSDCKYYERVRK